MKNHVLLLNDFVQHSETLLMLLFYSRLLLIRKKLLSHCSVTESIYKRSNDTQTLQPQHVQREWRKGNSIMFIQSSSLEILP